MVPLESAKNNDRMETLIRAFCTSNAEFGLPDGHDDSDVLVSVTIRIGDSVQRGGRNLFEHGLSPPGQFRPNHELEHEPDEDHV